MHLELTNDVMCLCVGVYLEYHLEKCIIIG